MRLIDLVGRRFGRLVVVARAENDSRGHVRWECLCDCGNATTVWGSNLKRKTRSTRSCGCLAQEARPARTARTFTKHGMYKSPEYRAWQNMRERCNNPKHPQFKDWGGRGITVCPEWMDSFEAFYADVGPRPGHRLSLDRIDNDGDYEPGNVRWATHSQQMKNRRPRKRGNQA